MRYAVGCDHTGLSLKRRLIEELQTHGHEVTDVGTHGLASVDYPLYAGLVARAISEDRADMGLLVCGTGLGMAMTANKFPGIRAAAVGDPLSARLARRHNNANVLCLGARMLGPGQALAILRAWLEEEFEGGRHQRRLDMMAALARDVAGISAT